MSIPTPFNPMGTLGAVKDYIQDGLLLLVDATREQNGTRNTLTNWATGETMQCSSNVNILDRYIRAADRSKFGDVAQNSSYYMELAFIPSLSISMGDIIAVYPWSAVNEKYCIRHYYAGNGIHYISYTKNWTSPSCQLHKINCLEPVVTVCSSYGAAQPRLFGAEFVGNWGGGGIDPVVKNVDQQRNALCSVRIYNRNLSEAEQMHNRKIDDLKFKQ